MAKELNKHTPDSEELFKRLESKDTGGLDEFEKEALEGFDSLDDPGLAKKLNAELNRKIDERFFEKEEKKGGNAWRYLSIAAGLVLIMGLTAIFTNIMGDKKELATGGDMSSDKVMNEVTKPADLVPLEESKTIVNVDSQTSATTNSAGKLSFSPSQPEASETDKKSDKDDSGLRSRMVVKEPKKAGELTIENPSPKTADAEGDDLKQQSDKNMGPPSGYATTPVTEDQKITKGKEEEKVFYKENNNQANVPAANVASNNAPANKDLSKKSEAPAKEKSKASGETFEQKPSAAMDEVTLSGVNSKAPADNRRDEHNAEFESVSFAKPQDYIKTEINKSEMLKENVKSFKAELSIDENGKVKEVKFLTKFDNCKGCEPELRKILLNMPGWKANKQGKKSTKETISYFNN
jgi:hypothetical protein